MQNNPLRTVAKQLIDQFKSHGEFLNFVCDAINWANQYPNADRENNGIFLLQELIKAVAVPWGSSELYVDKISSIESGLKSLCEAWGPVFYHKELTYVSLAQIHESNTSGQPSSEYATTTLKGMQALYSIGTAINEYDAEN